MLSRALSLATVMLLIGCLTAGVARAVENLDAGKSPSQIFSNTCSACHKSPRGLLKNMPASSLPGFLRQHYTTGTDMASVLSSYLISNGAADPRYQSKDQPKQKDSPGKKMPSRTEGRISPTGSVAGSRRPHLRRRLPGRMPTAHAARRGHASGPRREAVGRPQRRPTPPSLQMGRPRCRPRPTANRASGRSRAGVAGPSPKSRRKPSRQRRGDAAKEDASRDAAKPEPAKAELPGLSLTRLIPPRSIPPRPTRPRTRATSRPARQRSPPAMESRPARADPRPPRSMLPRRTSAASRLRSGLIRCRRSPRLRRQLPQRPRLSRPQSVFRRSASTGNGHGAGIAGRGARRPARAADLAIRLSDLQMPPTLTSLDQF